VLEGAGFALEDRYLVMVCTRDTFRPAPAVPGLEIRSLSSTDPLPLLRTFTSVQRRAFEEEGDGAPAEDSAGAEDFGQQFIESGAALALLDGEPASAVDFTMPFEGFTELVGLGTLPEFRRRGIGAALIAHATRTAFDLEVEVAFLTAADARAGRVYERVGFRPFASSLAYVERP
jgi:GNAT superfamily N-acetyltransferase